MTALDKAGVKMPLFKVWWWLSYVHREWPILQDYWAMARAYGAFLGRGKEVSDPNKVVLIVSLTDALYQVKIELVWAKVLQLHGYTPVIVTYRGCRWAQRYFRLAGLERFVYLDDYLEKSATAAFVGRNPLPTVEFPLRFHSLMGIEYTGVPVGVHVLSTLLARFQRGHLDLADPAVIQQARVLLQQSCWEVPAVRSLLDDIAPEKVLFLEKGYYPFAVFFELALERGLDAVQWVGATGERDAYCLKRYVKENRKDHPFSLSGQTWDRVKRMPWTAGLDQEVERMIEERYHPETRWNRNNMLWVKTTIKTASGVRKQLGLNPGKKTAVIFSHILWDATFFFGENLFDDYEQWMLETVRVACSNPAVNWVIKLHPDYVWKLKRSGSALHEPNLLHTEFGPLPDHVKLMMPDSDIDTFSLFEVTDYCITVRGTIGIEMSCFGIPVFTAGTGRYSGMGFTIDSSSREEYLDKMRRIQEFPPLTPAQVTLARKHAYALFRLRPLRLETASATYRPLEHVTHPLWMNIRIHASSIEEFAGAQDLNAFAKWATDPKELDFMIALPGGTQEGARIPGEERSASPCVGLLE